MQTVSSGFRQAINAHDRPYDEVYGTVTFSDNTTLSITPSIIPEWDVNIARQCIDGDELEFGGVFSSILTMSLITDKSRYAFFGATVDLSYRILVNGSFETLKLGKFNISTADRPNDNTVKFTAYDDMRLLDKSIPSDSMQGTPFGLFTLISRNTGYPLAFTESDLATYPNSGVTIYIDQTMGIKTYRDAVKVLCQLLGCFAQDDRSGRMELRKFSTTVDLIMTTANWYSLTPADYICSYVGLQITSASGTYSAVFSESEVGNVMQISDAPAWDYGLESALQAQTDRLFAVLRNIVYTPMSMDATSDPTIDCGDRLQIEAPNGTIESIVTSYEWKWHDGMELDSKGSNPYLEGVSTRDIASTRLLSKANDSNMFTYYTYVNASELVIGSEEHTRIANIRFMVGSKTTVTLWHEFKWLNEFTGDSQEITLEYYFDGDKQLYEPVHTYGEEGTHTFGTQYWIANIEPGQTHEWTVYAKTNNGTATIAIEDLHALVQGQNLAVSEEWDGLIELTDTIEPRIVLGLPIATLTDSLTDLTIQAPVPDFSLSDSFTASDRIVLGLPIASLTESSDLDLWIPKRQRITVDGDTRTTVDGTIRTTVYTEEE